MKKLAILFFAIISVSACSQQSNIYTKVVIKYVDFEIMTPFSIGCKNFAIFFGDEIKSIEITDEESLKIINSFITNLKVDTEEYFPDVRLILELHKDKNTVDTLCMSDIGVIYKGNAMLLSEQFLTFIETIKEDEE